MAALLPVSDSEFGRAVLDSPLPVALLLGAAGDPATEALAPLLAGLAAAYAGRVTLARATEDAAALVGGQYGVAALPALLVFAGGEVRARVGGFLPEGLLRAVLDEAAAGTLPGDHHWSPLESVYEERVLLPLLAAGGWNYRRQAASRAGARASHIRGRVDIVVYEPETEQPITLIESKRWLRAPREREQAVRQAASYARSLALPSFIVAAPTGLWAYRREGRSASALLELSSLDLHRFPERFTALLRRLACVSE